MTDSISAEQLETFLQELGKRYAKPATLFLLGGGALVLLGSSRPTQDIDYVGTDIPADWDDLQKLISEIASELDIKVDAVPPDMVPNLTGTAHRQIHIGNYGRLQVVIIDPYAITIGKLDRGFPGDLEDIAFLIRQNYIQMPQLEKVLHEILPLARQMDISSAQIQQNLSTVRKLLN